MVVTSYLKFKTLIFFLFKKGSYCVAQAGLDLFIVLVHKFWVSIIHHHDGLCRLNLIENGSWSPIANINSSTSTSLSLILFLSSKCWNYRCEPSQTGQHSCLKLYNTITFLQRANASFHSAPVPGEVTPLPFVLVTNNPHTCLSLSKACILCSALVTQVQLCHEPVFLMISPLFYYFFFLPV